MKLYHGTNTEFTNIDLKISRRSETPAHDYDVVIGPIADDTIGLQLFQFRKHYINIENLIENLKYKKLTFQYFFGTQKAISYLRRT